MYLFLGNEGIGGNIFWNRCGRVPMERFNSRILRYHLDGDLVHLKGKVKFPVTRRGAET